MKSTKFILVIAIVLVANSVFSQQQIISWDKWNHLIGEWEGVGDGKPGKGKGTFTFYNELDGNVLVRKAQTYFAPTANREEFTHTDIMYLYPDNNGIVNKAIYFDNENHVINYAISYLDNTIVLTSDIIPNVPRFRLSYIPIAQDTINVRFEVALPQNPEGFRIYLEGKSVRKK